MSVETDSEELCSMLYPEARGHQTVEISGVRRAALLRANAQQLPKWMTLALDLNRSSKGIKNSCYDRHRAGLTYFRRLTLKVGCALQGCSKPCSARMDITQSRHRGVGMNANGHDLVQLPRRHTPAGNRRNLAFSHT